MAKVTDKSTIREPRKVPVELCTSVLLLFYSKEKTGDKNEELVIRQYFKPRITNIISYNLQHSNSTVIHWRYQDIHDAFMYNLQTDYGLF